MGDSAAGADPLVGTEVGRFRLTQLLGKGGMGRVYLGVNDAIGLKAAIKVLSDEHAERPELVERFFNEARAVARIQHEAIVDVTDLTRLPNGRPCIVMEYIEGETLRQLVEAGPVAPAVAVPLLCDVLEGLDAAHAVGVIHRDLKPDNVIVTERGRAKILDFGIAKLADTQTVRTATGVVLGTPHYMAPEQVSGKPCDARTDVYAAGTLLFELVTGERPFAGATDFELMEAHLRSRVPMARVSPALDAAIAKAMAKEPDDRFASAAEMADGLRAALVAPAVSRTPRWMIAALVVVLAVAGFMVFVATRPPRRHAVTSITSDAAVAQFDAPVPIDAVPIDAATAIDAALIVDAPDKAKPRDGAPTHTCGYAGDCPRFSCTCNRTDGLQAQACVAGRCKKPNEICADACRSEGGYTGRYYVMHPLTEADCRAATPCKEHGQCLLRVGGAMEPFAQCVKNCRAHSTCYNYGACADPTDGSNVCQVTAEACEKRTDCSFAGFCGVRDNKCAATEAGCRASEVCKTNGWCKLVNGSCSTE